MKNCRERINRDVWVCMTLTYSPCPKLTLTDREVRMVVQHIYIDGEWRTFVNGAQIAGEN